MMEVLFYNVLNMVLEIFLFVSSLVILMEDENIQDYRIIVLIKNRKVKHWYRVYWAFHRLSIDSAKPFFRYLFQYIVDNLQSIHYNPCIRTWKRWCQKTQINSTQKLILLNNSVEHNKPFNWQKHWKSTHISNFINIFVGVILN